MPFRLPVGDKDIVALGERILSGIQTVQGLSSDPPVSPEVLESDLRTLRAALSDYDVKKAAAEQAAFTKNEARLACAAHLRQLRDWAETLVGSDDPRLAELGFAVQLKADLTPTESLFPDAGTAPPEAG